MEQIREKLIKEAEQEHQELLNIQKAEPITPRGLVGEVRRDKRKKQEQAPPVPLAGKERGKASSTRTKRELEQWLHESEKERRTLEMENTRLRDVITLRQDSCQRREGAQSTELTRLKDVLDGVSCQVTDPVAMMANLRTLNTQIQHDVSKLQETIELQSETEKLNLIRNFRVQMHKEKTSLEEKRQKTEAGAQDWIHKNKTLTLERERAGQDITTLELKNKQLEANNRTLIAMRKHQDQQRAITVRKIATIKKDNVRLNEQSTRLSEQIQSIRKRGSMPSPPPKGATAKPKLHLVKALGQDGVESRYSDAVLKARRMLESVRGALKKVRGAHIEYLQEHTELSILLRQCLDDVRKDIARHSVAHYTLRVTDSDNPDEKSAGMVSGLQGYSLADRMHLLEVLQSRERVLLLLSEKMFPYRAPNIPADVTAMPEMADGRNSPMGGEGGGMDDVDVTDFEEQHTAELDMDRIWSKWREWAQKM